MSATVMLAAIDLNITRTMLVVTASIWGGAVLIYRQLSIVP
jgi:hypothetical protein